MGLKCKTYFSGLLLLFLLYQPFSVAASSGSVIVGISPFKPLIFMDNQAPLALPSIYGRWWQKSLILILPTTKKRSERGKMEKKETINSITGIAVIAAILLLTMSTTLWALPASPELTLDQTGNHVSIKWSEVEGSSEYILTYSPYPDVDYLSWLSMGSQTELSFNLWSGAGFYIAVQAVSDEGLSQFSNIEHFQYVESSARLTLKIFHINDVHSNLDASDIDLTFDAVETECEVGGMARVAAKIKELQEKNENNLVLHAGDAGTGNPLLILCLKVKPMREVMNAIDFDAMAHRKP